MLYTSLLTIGLAALHLTPQSLASTIPSSLSLAPRAAETNNFIIPFPFDEDDPDAGELEKVFAIINDIPDSVIDEGGPAIKKWVESQTDLAARSITTTTDIAVRSAEAEAEAMAAELEPRQGLLKVLACAGAILKAVAENAVPIGKVRALIRTIGGVRKAAKVLLKARSFVEVLALGGPEAVELLEILLGVTDVVKACVLAF